MDAPNKIALSLLVVCAVVVTTPFVAAAQTGPVPAETKQRPNPYGSPLDTLMSTRLWTDVPPAKDFVKTTRPDSRALDYTPLSGKEPDPVRPKPRDPAGVEALRAELEGGGVTNEARAKGLRDPAKAGTRHTHKPATKQVSSTSAK